MTATTSSRAEILAALELWLQVRSQSPQDAVPTLETALVSARDLADAVLLAKVLVALGQVSSLLGKGLLALQYADEAVELLEPLGEEYAPDLVAAWRIVGRVQYDYGHDDQALEAFTKALAICTTSVDRVSVQSAIASIQIELGYLEEAITMHKQLIGIAENANDFVGVSHLRSNLAIALDRLAQDTSETELAHKHQSAALENAQLALIGARQTEQKALQSHVLRTLGGMALKSGSLDQAWDNFEESLLLARDVQSPTNEIHALHHLARIAENLQDYPRALSLANEALEKAEEHAYQEHASQAHQRLAEIFEAMQDYQAALKHERLHVELDALVKSQAAARRAEALAAQMQVERARAEAKAERERADALSRLNSQLELQALTDGLTGVANRRALTQYLERIHALSQRSEQVFSVALFDLDHFKLINDSFSHAVGDAVLRRIGLLLLEHCRKGDFVARYGGEEFALVLSGATGSTTFEICERFRLLIEETDWQSIQMGLAVTASFGFTDQTQLTNVDAILAVADQHLYMAKNSGRNQVYPMSVLKVV